MVERRNVVMGPKGKGRICPPWSAEGVRVRVVPCNTAPCPASCVESPLATDSEELVQKANNEFLIFTGIPPAGVSVLPEAKEIDEGPAEQGNEDKVKGSEVNAAKEDNEKDKDEEEDKETEDSHDKDNKEVKENGDKEEEENNEKDKEEEKEDKEKEDSNEKESSNEKDDDSEKAGQAAGEDTEDSEASTHSLAAFLNLRQSVHIYIYIYTAFLNTVYIQYIYFRPRITRQIGSMVTSQEIMLAA